MDTMAVQSYRAARSGDDFIKVEPAVYISHCQSAIEAEGEGLVQRNLKIRPYLEREQVQAEFPRAGYRHSGCGKAARGHVTNNNVVRIAVDVLPIA